MKNSLLRVLENKGTILILKMLYVDNEVMFTILRDELRKHGVGTWVLYKTLRALLESKLIKERRIYGARLFSLTNKGKMLIGKLLELEKELLKDP